MFKQLKTWVLLSAAISFTVAQEWEVEGAKEPANLIPGVPPPQAPPVPLAAAPAPSTIETSANPAPAGPNLAANAAGYTYVSLGSSYAAGFGILPYSNEAAGRSNENYAAVFAARHPEINLIDLAVSRGVLANLYESAQSASGTVFPSRVELIPADTKLVTITTGGNDMNFIGAIGSNGQAGGPGREALVGRYKAAIRATKAKAPQAKIVLLEYMTLMGTAAKAGPVTGVPWPADRVEYFAGVAEELRQITAAAAAGEEGVWVLPVAAESAGHGVGDPEPWSNGANGPREGGDRGDDGAAWHPNRRGMAAVAGMLDAWYSSNK